MAQQPQPHEFHYQSVQLFKTESLGVGSYGAVCKAMCDDLPCAAKILHPALFQFTAPETTSVMRKFEQECRLLSAIKHPHIVQYLGTYHDPESNLPVLLMELMDESLTRFLKRSHEPLPYHMEVNLCHDITLALSYLHSNGIVHRDLSSNNVLLIAGSRAKVTDFGMVKLYDVNHTTAHLTPLTVCPGTTVYMSPEALGEPPIYTDKLDSFSLGVLSVQIMTRQFPDPGNRFQAMEINDPRIPSGRVQVEIPEIERRKSHIDLINPAHPLLPVALNCLKDRDRERPSCHELCGRMSTLKASPKYIESVQQSQVNTKPTQSANRESREREIQPSQQIQDLQQQLHTKDDQLREKEQENLELWTLLSTKDEQLAGKDHQLQQKETAIAAHQQEIQQLRQQLQTKDGQLQSRKKEIQQQQEQILGLQSLVTSTTNQLEILTTKNEQLADKVQQLACKNHQQKEAAIAAHQQEIQQLRQQLQTKDGQLQRKEEEIKQQQDQIIGLQNLVTATSDQPEILKQKLATKDEQLAGKDHRLQQKEAAIAAHQQEIQQLRQQLQSSEQVTAEFQQNLLEKEKMIQDQWTQIQDYQIQIQELQSQILKLRKQTRRNSREPRVSQEKMEASGAAASGSGIKLRWKKGRVQAPCEMYGQVAAVDEGRAYFRSGIGKKVYSYDSSSEEWLELPECPNHGFSLAVVNSLLTAIGGKTPSGGDKTEVTNSLLSLIDNKWTEVFPPMPTKRWLTAVVCSGKSLVVAGGLIADKRLGTVEMMDTDTETPQWSSASSLPHLLSEASATLCEGHVYIVGGFDQSQQSKSVFTCSLGSLRLSCRPLSLGARRKPSEHKVWHQLADAPVTLSTCASLRGKLLAVGGCDLDNKKRTTIHMYNPTTNSWEGIISPMTTPRSQCLVAVLPHDKLIVVGGNTSNKSVEIASIV